MKLFNLLSFLFVWSCAAYSQTVLCDTMSIAYVSSGIRFTDAVISSADSAIVIPLVNNTGTNFAYPQAKLINVSPLPAGMTLSSLGWVVFASSWNVGDTASASILYDVSAAVPDNFVVKFNLYVTNFLPLTIDSCVFSDTLSINLKPAVGTGLPYSTAASSSFSLYPNPAHTTISFTASGAGSVVDLYTATGVLLRTVPTNKLQKPVDISDLPAGMYFVRERVSGLVRKFVKSE